MTRLDSTLLMGRAWPRSQRDPSIFISSLDSSSNNNMRMSSRYSSPTDRFNETEFRRSVDQALVQCRRLLSTARHPVRASEVDHQYTDKYALAEFLTNVAIASELNVLDRLGLEADQLATLRDLAAKDDEEVTLRFDGGLVYQIGHH